MVITLKKGKPEELFEEVKNIVSDCFEGVWSEDDLKELIEIPHESKFFIVAYDDDKPIGYAYIVVDYVESVDTKIASIQELGVLPNFREKNVVESFLDDAIQFSKANKAELIEQVVSSVDQWIIPTLINKNLKPSEIKADREISSTNEAKLILKNLSKNPKLTVLMNQLFFEKDNELESLMIEDPNEIDDLVKNNLIAFGSIISVNKAEELEDTLNELNKLEIEWDEIGITFDYLL